VVNKATSLDQNLFDNLYSGIIVKTLNNNDKDLSDNNSIPNIFIQTLKIISHKGGLSPVVNSLIISAGENRE
jgi:hypothetical protein